MGRLPTGTVVEKHGRFFVRVTLETGERRLFGLPRSVKSRQEAEARKGEVAAEARAAEANRHARQTVSAYVERWSRARLARGTSTPPGLLRRHILPVLGKLEIGRASRRDIERLVESLDGKVRREILAPATAQQAFAVTCALFDDAARSKNLELRVRDDDPTEGVRGPDRGAELGKVYLYPSEFASLIACEAVPIGWREFYFFAAYTGLRAGELEALRQADVDLERRVLTVHQAVDRARGGVKTTKGRRSRKVPIEPALARVLASASRAGRPPIWLAPGGPFTIWSKRLRAHLGAAGVTRSSLFESGKTSRRIRFHDLRASYATWLALAGIEPMKIMQRLGHRNLKTTMLYVREAESFTDPLAPFGGFPLVAAGEDEGKEA